MRLGVDLGGSKIEVAALAGDGRIAFRERAPTPRDDYPGTLDAIAGLVARAEGAVGPARPGIGVGIPGSPRPADGRVHRANSTWLNGSALRPDLEARLARPVRLANDADCFALAEARAGAGQGAGVVLGLILGTGVGAGVVVGGRALCGPNGGAGEWGHTPLDPTERSAPLCWCGRRGCVEARLSGPALAAAHGARTGTPLAPDEIAARAASGDADAGRTLGAWLATLGRALGPVVSILDPDVVVLGGGLSNLPGLARDLGPATRPHVFGEVFAARVVTAALGDSAGVVGAAWLWPEAGAPDKAVVMTDTTEETARLKRLRMRSWRRGTREMDLILGPFADAKLGEMDDDTLDAYETLLDENDQDLYAWISGRSEGPERHAPMLGAITDHFGVPGPSGGE